MVGAITPWNFPIAIPAWKSCPALISGNAVVLKPSELAPLCATRLAEILSRPACRRACSTSCTARGEAGAALVAHEQVRAISFTGSEATGSKVAEVCGKRRARVQLEMGGKNPTIVLADADLDEAAGIVLNAAFGSTGQRCTATSRAIVERSVADAFSEKLVAKAKAMKVGPGLESGHRRRAEHQCGACRSRRHAKSPRRQAPARRCWPAACASPTARLAAATSSRRPCSAA